MSDTPIDPGQNIEDVLNSMGSLDEATAWVRAHAAELSEDQRSEALVWVQQFTLDAQSPPAQEWEAIFENPTPPSVTDPGSTGFDAGAMLQSLDPSLVDEWFAENYATMDADNQGSAREWLSHQGSSYPGAQSVVEGRAATGAEVTSAATETAFDDATQAAADWIAENLSPEQVATGQFPALPPELRPAGLTGQEYDSWLAEAQQAGKAAAQDKAGDAYRAANPGASDDEVAQVVGSQFDQFGLATDVPTWMLQEFGGGATWNNAALRQRAVDYWNDNHGTYFTEFSQIAPYLERMGPTAEGKEFVGSVVAEQEPLISHSIRIPFVNGAQSVTYTAEEMATLRDMGFSNDAITRLVRLNALQLGADGLQPGPTGTNTADIFSMAALLRYYGGAQDYGAFNQSQQDIAELEQKAGLKPGDWGRMTIEERQKMRAELVRKQRNAQASPGREGAPTPYDDDIRTLDQLEAKLRGQGVAEEHSTNPGILASRNNLNRGLATYNGDPVLAFISSIDANLAQRIASTDGDLEKLGGQDNAAAMKILDRAGISSRGTTFWERLGGSGGQIGQNVMAYLNYFDFAGGGGGGGGGAGPVRRMIDPVSVKEQLQGKFADLMLPDIPDEVVASVQKMLQDQLDKSPQGMNFDVSARILDWVKGRPEYADLYGRKPEGMTEGEYQGQFQAGVQDMLGAQADPDAVKAGLRGNDYQAAVGVASIGGLAGHNSRLLGRWALAKQTLDKFS